MKMKKQLSLLAMLVFGTSIASAAVLNLDEVFDGAREFGYSENQNITVGGFQARDDSAASDFLIQTPILKDSKDVAVGEYYVLLGTQPMSNYIGGDMAVLLRNDLIELPVYETMALDGSYDINISEDLVNTETTYYGLIVPVNDNVQAGTYSTEFCFNFGTKKYAEGDACKSFGTSRPAEKTGTTSEGTLVAAQPVDDEHGAADGADMSMADISHYIQDGVVTLTWTAVPYSENVEIKIFDKDTTDYVTLGTVPMSQEKFQYTYKDTDEELLFAFIPRDSKGREYRYDVNVRHEADVAPTIKNVPATGPVEDFFVMAAITLALYAGYRIFVRKAE